MVHTKKEILYHQRKKGLGDMLCTNLYIARKVSCMVPAMEPAMYGQYLTFVATEA